MMSSRKRQRGFTLTELMVSLVMGLIVALAAVALAKASTATFHEQARLSGVEMTLRQASERMRNDLSRASYMSSPNIQLDPKVARRPGSTGSPLAALAELQGIHIKVGASKAATEGTDTLATFHNLNPDDLYLVGNLTSDDSYRGTWSNTGAACGASITLNANADPGVARLLNGATSDTLAVQAAQAVFMPGHRMTPPDDNTSHRYAVQLMDMRGCFHYVQVCSITATNPTTVVLDVGMGGSTPIYRPADLSGDVCGANMGEAIAIAPIQRVHYFLAHTDPIVGADLRTTDTALDASKFNLYRQLLDAVPGGGAVGQPVGTAEVIGEYAIDMKFGLTVHDATATGAASIVTYDMDTNGTEIADWTKLASTTTARDPGPHRIRSVRYRLAFRAALPDRRVGLPWAGANGPFLTRYRTGGATAEWARVRTVVSEVALTNQAKLWVNPADGTLL